MSLEIGVSFIVLLTLHPCREESLVTCKVWGQQTTIKVQNLLFYFVVVYIHMAVCSLSRSQFALITVYWFRVAVPLLSGHFRGPHRPVGMAALFSEPTLYWRTYSQLVTHGRSILQDGWRQRLRLKSLLPLPHLSWSLLVTQPSQGL